MKFRMPSFGLRFQADAGQTINQILRRKDFERQAGGTFWWGIGESKGRMIRLLAEKNPRPTVIFSLMLTRPHRRSSNPDGVLLWDAYKTETGGTERLPPHAVVISGAHDSAGNQKSTYYSLVCAGPDSIYNSDSGTLNIAMLRNFGDNGRPIGPSQVTAVAERTTARSSASLHYPVTARATLVAPFAVKLIRLDYFHPSEKQLLDEVSLDGKNPDDWMRTTKLLRQRTTETTQWMIASHGELR